MNAPERAGGSAAGVGTGGSPERSLWSTTGEFGAGGRSGGWLRGKYVEDGTGAPCWEFGAQDVKAIGKAVG